MGIGHLKIPEKIKPYAKRYTQQVESYLLGLTNKSVDMLELIYMLSYLMLGFRISNFLYATVFINIKPN